MSIPTFTLSSGNKIPVLGLGTFRSDPGVMTSTIKFAIDAGYRYFDCAEGYNNQKEIGTALKLIFAEGKVRREDIFITSKVNNHHHSAQDVEDALKTTLADLQTPYLDLLLIHWPVCQGKRIPLSISWAAMEKLKKSGLVLSIGVSNFNVQLLNDLLSYCEIPPSNNQVEINPFLQQPDLIQFCQKQNILVTAYCPIARPSAPTDNIPTNINANPVILEIAKKYGKTPSQIVLRWGLQRKTIDYFTKEPLALTNVNVIPKATSKAHIEENIKIFDFVLEDSDLEKINGLEKGIRLANPIVPFGLPNFA